MGERCRHIWLDSVQVADKKEEGVYRFLEFAETETGRRVSKNGVERSMVYYQAAACRVSNKKDCRKGEIIREQWALASVHKYLQARLFCRIFFPTLRTRAGSSLAGHADSRMEGHI